MSRYLLLLSLTLVGLSTSSPSSKTELKLIVTGPYPPGDGAWDGGLALIAAVRLAFEQINNYTDILPNHKLVAVEADSGCEVAATYSLVFVREVFYRSQNIVGVIGPGCSTSVLLLAPILALPNISIIQIAPSATSPEIQQRGNKTTFTMQAPFEMVNNTINLMQENQWQQCAALYDPHRPIFTALHNKFLEQTRKAGINVNFSSIVSPVEETNENISTITSNPISQLLDSQLRIIVLFLEPMATMKIMCLAYKSNMTYPTYQWILVEKSIGELDDNINSFVVENVEYNCTRGELDKALNGSIITEYTLNRTNDQIITPLNITYREYRESFNKTFEDFLDEKEVQDLINQSGEPRSHFIRQDYWENPYYDAAWIYAQALDAVIKRGYDLSNYTYGQEHITDVILEEMYKVSFEGASGPVRFAPSMNVHSPIITSQLLCYENGTLGVVRLCNRTNDEFVCGDDYQRIPDKFESTLTLMHVAVAALLIIAALSISLFTLILQSCFVLFGDIKSVKATSPNMSHLIFSGCYLYCIASLLYTIQQFKDFRISEGYFLLYSILCNSVAWCINIGTSLIFGTVLFKVWRIYKIFRRFNNQKPTNLLTDRALICFVLLLIAVDVAFCICWMVIDPYVLSIVPILSIQENINMGQTDIQVSQRCSCEHLWVWLGIAALFKGVIIFLLVVFATLNRSIKKRHFSHTKIINLLIYCLTIVCGAGGSLFIILSAVKPDVYVSVLLCFVLLCSVILCCIFLFVPPLLRLELEDQQLSPHRRTNEFGKQSSKTSLARSVYF